MAPTAKEATAKILATAAEELNGSLEKEVTGMDSWPVTSLQALVPACVLSHFSGVQLCDPMDCSLPGSSAHGMLQARILEWVAMPSSRGSSRPRDQTVSPQAESLPLAIPGKPHGL